MPDEQYPSIEARFDGVDSRLDRVESRLDGIDSRLDGLGSRLDQVDRNMHVLHEDLVDRIKALAPDFGPVQREFRSEIADLRESTDRRLIPLETAERMRRRPKRKR